MNPIRSRVGVGLVLLCAGLARAEPVTSTFTYQGRLRDNGVLRTGVYDFTFELIDPASPAEPLHTLVREEVLVNQGLFTLPLTFPSGHFFGERRALRVSVRPGDSTGAFTTLPGLQELTASPYSQFAVIAGNAMTSQTSLYAAYLNGSWISTIPRGPVVLLDGARQIVGRATEVGFDRWSLGNDESGAQFLMFDPQTRARTVQIDASDDGGAPLLLLERPDHSLNVLIDLSLSGDESVRLPIGAIDSSELLDEPGVAATHEPGTIVLNAAVGYQAVLSQTISAPAPGFVLAAASGSVTLDHASGIGSFVHFSLATTPGNGGAHAQQIALGSTAPSCTLTLPFACQDVIAVQAGATTIFLNVAPGPGISGLTGVQLSLLYIPTSYGGVTSTAAVTPSVVAGPPSPALRPVKSTGLPTTLPAFLTSPASQPRP